MADVLSDRLWTIHDAAGYLHVPVSAIYKMTARQASVRIPHVRLAGRLRFRRCDLDAWLELLTVSNLSLLQKAQEKARRASHGIDSHTETRKR
jgi:excisionase family DNA binding protein